MKEFVKVRLLKPHEHESIPRQPGEVIELSQDLAAWLCNEGVAELANKKTAAPAAEKE